MHGAFRWNVWKPKREVNTQMRYDDSKSVYVFLEKRLLNFHSQKPEFVFLRALSKLDFHSNEK